MAHLITFEELARWTQNDPTDVTADPFAAEVLDKVSGLARFLGGHPDWEIAPVDPLNTVPYDVRLVVLAVAKRCYENPGQVVQEGSIGPIGGDRVLDVAALLFELSEAERAVLTKYNADGDPDQSGIFVIRTTPRPETTSDAVLFVPVDSLSDWYIPMFNPLDPGDPELYPEEG